MLTKEDIKILNSAKPDDTLVLDDGRVVNSAFDMIELCEFILKVCKDLDKVVGVDPDALSGARKCAQEMIDSIQKAKNYLSTEIQ